MNRLGILVFLCVCAYGGAWILFRIPEMPRVAAQTAKVDPRVWADTADGQTARWLVILKAQADTRAVAANARGAETRARLVFDALRQTAHNTQPGVRSVLDVFRAKYRAYWIINAFAVEGDRTLVEALAARGDVKAIESDRAFRVALERPENFSPGVPNVVEWNIAQVNAPALWAKGYTGQNIVYANADTGVQWDHPALQPHYRGWNGSTPDHNYNWYDAITTTIVGGSSCGYSLSAPCDDYPHGTHTMGTGIGDDGAGNQIGMAPGAKWIACRNMDRGTGRPSTYLACFQFFLAPTDVAGNNPDVSKRPDVVGNSYDCRPSEQCSPNSLLMAMDNLRAARIFMAVSAGNSGPGCSTVSDPPGLYDSAITAGATNSNDTIASFSSRGPVTADSSNRRKPDLVAPGVSVRSSFPTNDYVSRSGTSMAAPHVAGAVALLWSAFPDLRGNVEYTEYVLEQSAVHLTTTDGCGGDSISQVPNNTFGYGRIDVLNAYNYYLAYGRQRLFLLIFNNAGQ